MNVPHADVGLVTAFPSHHVVAVLGKVQAGESFSAGVGDEKLAVLPGIVKHNSTPTRQKEKQESFTNNSKKS